MDIIISLLSYFGTLKAQQSFGLRWYVCVALAVAFPFIVNELIVSLILTGGFVGLGATVVFAVQLVAASVLFYYLEAGTESITAWVVTSVAGALGIYFVIPFVVNAIL